MKLLHWLDENLEKTVCVVIFMAFTAVMIVNIFMRYVVGQAIPWASDLVLYLFVWFVWFAISYGFRNGAHVNVTAVVGLMPQRVQKFFRLLCLIIALLGFCYLFVNGCRLLTDSSVAGQTGLLFKYPLWSLYLATPVGSGLSIIRILQCLYEEIRRKEHV